MSGGWTRRDVLRAAGALAAVPSLDALGGCGLVEESGLQVAVAWSGLELSRFREVVRGYDHAVTVVSAGEAIDGFIRARRAAGNTPDVAILSRPGLVEEYARRGWIAPLPSTFPLRQFDGEWTRLVTFNPDGGLPRVYGAWVKAAHKSLLWYRRTGRDIHLATWEDLVAFVREDAAAARAGGGPAPLAIGADDGWVLTDWFENALAAQGDADFYDELARGGRSWRDDPVRDALAQLTEVWRIPGAFPGGAERARVTQHEESVVQVVGTEEASVVMGADFARVIVEQHVAEDEPVGTVRVPGVDRTRPLVVGGDCAVVLRPGDPDPDRERPAQDFVRWLADGESFAPWIAAGGYLTPNTSVPAGRYEDADEGVQLVEVQEPGSGWRFDLSDLLPVGVGGSPGQGLWWVLQELFASVAGVGPGPAADQVVEEAVDAAVGRMDRIATEEREVASGASAAAGGPGRGGGATWR